MHTNPQRFPKAPRALPRLLYLCLSVSIGGSFFAARPQATQPEGGTPTLQRGTPFVIGDCIQALTAATVATTGNPCASGTFVSSIEEDNVEVVADAATLNFSTGFDITDAGSGQANVSIDAAELEGAFEAVLDLQDLQGAVIDAQVPNSITLDNITQITNRAIGDTTGDLAAARVDDGGAAATQALFSGAGGSAGFRAIADDDVPNNITIDLAATATALAADPNDCAANNVASSIDAAGDLGCVAHVGAASNGEILWSNNGALDGVPGFTWSGSALSQPTTTLSGLLTTSNLGIGFTESDTNPACNAGDYYIYADLSETTLKKCLDGVASDLDTGGAGGVGASSDTELLFNNSASVDGVPGSVWNGSLLTLPATNIASNTFTQTHANNPTFSVIDSTDSITTSMGSNSTGNYGWLVVETNHPLRFGSNGLFSGAITAAGAWQFWDRTDNSKILSWDLSSLATTTTRSVQPPTADGALFSLGMTLDVSSNTNLGGTSPIVVSGDNVTCPTCLVDGDVDASPGVVGIDASGDAVIPRDLTITRNLIMGGGDPWNLTGLTDDSAPGAPGSANQFTSYVDRALGRFATHRNGVTDPEVYVADSDVRWAPTISLMGALATGDAQACTIVPPAFTGYTGWVLIGVSGRLLTADTTGVNVQVAKVEGATPANMLSTAFTTDAGETLGSDATAPAVIDALEDDVLPEDLVCLDVDAADDGVTLAMALEFAPL